MARRVSIMTADSSVRNFYQETNIFLHCFISDYAHSRRSSVLIIFPKDIQLKKTIRRRHSIISIFFQGTRYVLLHQIEVFVFFLFIPFVYYRRITLAPPPSSKSDPGSHRWRALLPHPTTVRAFLFIAEIHFLPSSTRVELTCPRC